MISGLKENRDLANFEVVPVNNFATNSKSLALYEAIDIPSERIALGELLQLLVDQQITNRMTQSGLIWGMLDKETRAEFLGLDGGV